MDNDSVYYSQSRPEMLRFIPASTRRLLDIGCGEGRFGEAVKKMLPHCETWGVEPIAEAAAAAATRNDKVFNTGIGALDDLPAAYFDVVTLNDVLEHIDYSEPVLAFIRTVLKRDGTLIISLPNVRYYLTLRDVVFRKDWKYQDFGVLDRTHLRFFTQRSATRLLTENGFSVNETSGINPAQLKPHYRALFAAFPGFFGDMRYPQFAIVAQPAA